MATLSEVAKTGRLGMTEGPIAPTNLTPDQYARSASIVQGALGIAPMEPGRAQLSAIAGARRSTSSEPKITLYGTLGQRLKAIEAVKQSISNHYARYDASKRRMVRDQASAKAELERQQTVSQQEQELQQNQKAQALAEEQERLRSQALSEQERLRSQALSEQERRSSRESAERQRLEAEQAARLAEQKSRVAQEATRRKSAQEAAQARLKSEQESQAAALKKQQDDYNAARLAGEKAYQEAEKKPKREYIEKIIKTRQDNYMKAMARKDPNSMLVYNPGLAHITNGGDGYTVEIPEFPSVLAPDDKNYKAPGGLPPLENYLAPYEQNFKVEPGLSRVYWQLKPEQREGYMRAYESELYPTPEGMGYGRQEYLDAIGFKLDPNKPLIKEPSPGWRGVDPAPSSTAQTDPRENPLPKGSDQPGAVNAAYKRPYDLASRRYLLDNPDVARSGLDPWDHYVKYGAAQGKFWPGETKPGATVPEPKAKAVEPQGSQTGPGVSAPKTEPKGNPDNPNATAAPSPTPKAAPAHQPGYQLFTGSPELPDEPAPVQQTPAPQAAAANLTYQQAAARYLQDNPDVARAGMDPWDHYTRYGQKEGRVWRGDARTTPQPGYQLFTGSPELPDEPAPVQQTPAPQAAAANLTYQQAAARYLQDNPDVARAGMDPWTHYTRYGQKEGRVWRGAARTTPEPGYQLFTGSPEM